MIHSLVQLRLPSGGRALALRADNQAHLVPGVSGVYVLAGAAIAAGRSLLAEAQSRGQGEAVDLLTALSQGQVLAAIDHPDPTHLHLNGTGLTHLGSAQGRDRMHKDSIAADKMTDTMRMFMWGVEGGKPAAGEVGSQPEWFHKGNGHCLVGPEQDLPSPAFAQDGGEEPELCGVYLIGPDGTPYRLGHALANEFSDHVIEKQNYLWLAHSKLRHAAIGGELLLGPVPDHVEGVSQIRRDGAVVWAKPFLSGESNMSHSLANLEHHHFKYAVHCQPGDVHVHCFGTATVSFADGFKTLPGDVFEIAAAPFLLPLRNTFRPQPPVAREIKAL